MPIALSPIERPRSTNHRLYGFLMSCIKSATLLAHALFSEGKFCSITPDSETVVIDVMSLILFTKSNAKRTHRTIVQNPSANFGWNINCFVFVDFFAQSARSFPKIVFYSFYGCN
jgi:hypothetical protein